MKFLESPHLCKKITGAMIALSFLWICGCMTLPVAAEQQQSFLSFDTPALSLNQGDYREIRVDFSEGIPENWETIAGEGILCEKLDKQADSAGYLRVTALEPGKTHAGIRTSDGEFRIPVTVSSSDLAMDTVSEILLEPGQRYGFLVSGISEASSLEVTADGMSLSEVERDGLPDGTRYFEIEADSAGRFRVTAETEDDLVAFPVLVTIPEMMQRAQEYSSPTEYLVMTDLSTQITRVFSGEKGAWVTEKIYLSSSGAPGMETPTGVFHVQGRGSWFYNSRLESGAKWYVGFYGDYLYHSLPMDASQNITDERLGEPLSHGCIRLRVEDAKWMYDNIPTRTTVVIYESET